MTTTNEHDQAYEGQPVSKERATFSANSVPFNAEPLPGGTGYTGHGAGTGGLQQHSVGDLYPLTIAGKTFNGGPTMWQAMDLISGWKGRVWHTYKQAEIEAFQRRIYAMMNS